MKVFFFSKIPLIYSITFLLLYYGNLSAQDEISTLSKIEELRSKPEFKPTDPDHIDLIIELAREQIRTNVDSTESLLKEGYQLSIDSNYPAGESSALSAYGYLYFEKGDTDKAYEYNMNALKIANNYNLSKEKLKALNNMGLDFWLQGDSSSALTKFLEALTVATESNNVDMIISLNVNIANLYSDNGDHDTSLTFLETAQKLNEEHNNEEILAYTLVNLADQYADIGKYTQANDAINMSIIYFEKHKKVDWMAHAYEQKGSVALKEQKYNEALIWLKKSEKICNEIDFKYGYTNLYTGIAECFLGLKNVDEAEKYAKMGLEICTELSIVAGVIDANLILSKIYHEKGQDLLAYTYQTTYLELHEKSSTEKFKKGLGILRSKMQFENQKKQLIEDQNKAINKQKSYVYYAIAALFILSIILVHIYRTNKLQKKFTKNLQEKQLILIKNEAELSKSNETKDKLFSIIAHDLKGPINSFYMLMKMSFDETISKSDYDTFFPKALKEIQGISEMLNNLLVWAKTQMQGILPKQENLDIHEIVTHTVSVLMPLFEKKEISVINMIPENTISFSDRNHLNIIIRNLISNAMKFTHIKGEIRLNVLEKEDSLQIEITDNGVGMDAETLANLFELKHLKSTFGTNNEKGTGLGLSICKDLVESNGGIIWVSSLPNQGTTIYFTVPKKLEKVLG